MQVTLPQPDSAALAHSQQCQAFITQRIQAQGYLRFADYMQLALYAPGLGYYTSGTTKLGAGGDFITAPEISPLFGACIARFCQRLLSTELPRAQIVEFGAGSGRLAYDVLRFLTEWGCLPTRYAILDVSADLRARQQALLDTLPPQARDCVVWLDTLAQDPQPTIFLANEVLDAMPVHRILLTPDDMQEYVVILDANKQLSWDLRPIQSTQLAQQVAEIRAHYLPDLDRPYTTEINLHIQPWLTSLAQACQSGYVLLCDYGFQGHEYFHPGRYMGTLMCHYRHHAHDDPFYYPGLQDITAHVDFSAVAHSAEKTGWCVTDFSHQAGFLFEHDIDEFFQTLVQTEREQLIHAQALKKLTLPHEMGELFKVMILNKKPAP